jgi:hypothetical protein
MQNTTMAPLVEQITQQLQTLSEDQLRTIQDFVDYLVWKQQRPPTEKRSAEARAIERLQDLDHPSQWITVVEADEDIDEEALDIWLDSRGYNE